MQTSSSSPHVRVANFRSREGRRFRVEYVILPETISWNPTYSANYVSIYVAGMPHERVSAVLVNRFMIPGDEHLSETVHIVELTGDDGVFKGFLQAPIPATLQVFSGFNVTCMPQIAVVVDGVWQVDPIQPGQQHNFNFAWLLS
jgi:hypothetical protein